MYDFIIDLLEDKEEVVLNHEQLEQLKKICSSYSEDEIDYSRIESVLNKFSSLNKHVLSKKNVEVIINLLKEKYEE